MTERQTQAMAMRLAGASFRQIASRLGVSAMQAFRDVGRVLDETIERRDRSAEQLREQECRRLDALLLAIWPAVQNGDASAVQAAVRVSERRARLLGLDMATAAKLELSGAPLVVANTMFQQNTLSDEEVVRLEARLPQLVRFLESSTIVDGIGKSRPDPAPEQLSAAERYERELQRREQLRRFKDNDAH